MLRKAVALKVTNIIIIYIMITLCLFKNLTLSGLSHAVGTLARRGIKSDADGASVERLRNAGFIPLVVSNCPEYCSGLESNNLLTGATNNPYNTHYSVGGSSGGEVKRINVLFKLYSLCVFG